MLLNNGGFAMAASQNGVCIAQEKCHKMVLVHNCSMTKEESNQ